MAKKARWRPVRGDYGDIINGILRSSDPDLLNMSPWALGAKLRHENGLQVQVAEAMGSPFLTPRQIKLAAGCPPILLRNATGWPCNRAWACPFCFTDAVLRVWDRIKAAKFQVKIHRHWFEDVPQHREVGLTFHEADAWLDEQAPTARFHGRILWRWVDPGMFDGVATVRYAAVTASFEPTDKAEIEAEFIQAFQFNHSWLRSPPMPLLFALAWMGERTGRRISGRFRSGGE